jgi:hypothetical protein
MTVIISLVHFFIYLQRTRHTHTFWLSYEYHNNNRNDYKMAAGGLRHAADARGASAFIHFGHIIAQLGQKMMKCPFSRFLIGEISIFYCITKDFFYKGHSIISRTSPKRKFHDTKIQLRLKNSFLF